jgi:hypothetical protein
VAHTSQTFRARTIPLPISERDEWSIQIVRHTPSGPVAGQAVPFRPREAEGSSLPVAGATVLSGNTAVDSLSHRIAINIRHDFRRGILGNDVLIESHLDNSLDSAMAGMIV